MINNSSAKHTYAFGNENRFLPVSQINATSCYDHKSGFGRSASVNSGGFGTSTKRFSGNLGVGISDPKNFSPAGGSYFGSNFTGLIGKTLPHENRDNRNKTRSYSFGVGRRNMKKNFVHKIEKGTDGHTNVPGSGSY